MAVLMKSFFTKHDYLRFKQCPRLFAYGLHGQQQKSSNETSYGEFLIQQGQEVGKLARSIFEGPKSKLITDLNFEMALESTRNELKKCSVLFEGAFEYQKFITRPDVLDLNNLVITEIKATTGVKDEHLLDVGFQLYILKNSGISLNKIQIGHLNRNYHLQESLKLDELFVFNDVTKEVFEYQNQLEKELQEMLRLEINPERYLGKHCSSGVGCVFKEDCWKDLGDDTILNLRRDVSGKKYELHRAGVKKIKDIPEYVKLTKFQSLQKEAEILDSPVIDTLFVNEALNGIEFPLFFLDFETISFGVPKYQGTTPFQQVPFQASIHEWKKPKASLRHYSFLQENASDPRSGLIRFLIQNLGDVGTIVAYHASFEISRMYELIRVCPDKEEEIVKLINRVWDLEKIFEKGYVHKDFKGSTSIKKIIEVLCPELSYDDLNIQNGAVASVLYNRLIDPTTEKKERIKIKNDLEAYCERDTYSMYAILKKILEQT